MLSFRKKHIDFTRAYKLASREVKDAGGLIKDEAEQIADYIKEKEEAVVEKAKEIYRELPPVKKERQRMGLVKWLRLFTPLLIGLFILLITLAGISIWMFGKIYFESIKGKENLEQAVVFIRQGDYDSAMSLSRQAEKNFKDASIKADEMESSVLSYLPLIGSSSSDVKYLLTTANILARTVSQGVVISRELNGLLKKSNTSFSKYSEEEKGRILGYLYKSGPELVGLKANLDLASLNLEKVQFSILLYPAKGSINKLKSELNMGREFLESAIPATKFLPELAGYPKEKRFLFLLQNNDELRPGGGFIGNYGIIETKNGDILHFDTDDSYHLDMPVKDKLKIEPPPPLKKHLIENWYFRDSNWSPDFTETAKTAEWFYKQENGLAKVKANDQFDGIIAITPKLISDLLAITGPITLEGHEYNKDNFSELLEYRVEVAYREKGESEWNRKEMVGKIASELKVRLLDLPLTRLPEVFKAVSNNITEKNIMVYFNDCDLERLAIEEGIAGELKPAADDYLMVVDANMASFKTDSVMNKNLLYEVEERGGELVAKVTAHYAHQGGYDWRTTKYQTYTRVYVPAGAKLIRAEGFTGEVETGQDQSFIPSACFKAQNDKMYFGGYFTVEPGKIKNFTVEYSLPKSIQKKLSQGEYGLYLQKQPGNRTSEVQVELNLNNKIGAYSPQGFSVEKIKNNQILWKTDLNTDKAFSVNTE